MNRRAFPLLALLLLLPGSSRAQDPGAPGRKGVLARAIRLVEEPEEKKGPYSMPFGTTPQDVDINSTIRVRISTDDLLAGLAGNPVLTPAAQETAALRRSAEELKKADALLQSAIANATKLAQLAAEGKQGSPEFGQIAREDQSDVFAMLNIVVAHMDALKASPRPELRAHADEARERSNQAIPRGRLAYAAFVVEEIRWTLEQLDAARARLEKDSPSLALILSASLVRPDGATEAGLPHYNDIPIGVPKSVDKLNLALTPEQIALQQGAAELAGVLNNAVQGSAELQEALRALLAAKGIDLTALEDALDRVKEDAAALRDTDWRRIGDDLEGRLRQALQDATADQRNLLEETLIPAAEALQARGGDLRTTLPGLLASVETLKASFSGSSAQDPAAQVVALLTVAQAGADLASGELFQTLRAELDLWSRAVTSLESQVDEVRASADDLPEELRDQVEEILGQAGGDELGALKTHLVELRTAAVQVGGQLRTAFKELEGASALAVALDQPPPDTAFRVAFRDIKDTWLDIRTLNPRDEDDVVVLRAWLYRMEPSQGDPTRLVEGEELDSDLQQLRLLRFGWYSDPGVGVVYMSSVDDLPQGDGEEKQTRAFAPQVAWLLRHRSWRTSSTDPVPPAFRFQPRWWHSMSLGLHTLSLDLDNDNQQELGLGFSVSLFNNFLQIGGGWDVGLDDEPYVFVGTKLLDVAGRLGVSRKPAAPPE